MDGASMDIPLLGSCIVCLLYGHLFSMAHELKLYGEIIRVCFLLETFLCCDCEVILMWLRGFIGWLVLSN